MTLAVIGKAEISPRISNKIQPEKEKKGEVKEVVGERAEE